MFLKAMLICDDVRVEASGTVTLVGVYNERMIAAPGEGPIRLARLSFVAIVGGLTGRDSIGFRQRIREIRDPDVGLEPLSTERHNPKLDEHNFVFSEAPMLFAGPGTYEVTFDIETGDESATYKYRFHLERARDQASLERRLV